MAEETSISWCDSTINFWWGCEKVGPGCENCYAEVWSSRFGEKLWGANGSRRKIKKQPGEIRALNRAHDAFFAEHGRRRSVFMSSMGDLFDVDVPEEWRLEAYEEAAEATNLDIIFLTKRLPNVAKHVPNTWSKGWPSHIGLMATMVTQEEVNRDQPRLINLKRKFNIPWVGISSEPQLEPIVYGPGLQHVDVIVTGGETGKNRRPFDVQWGEDTLDQCEAVGTLFHFKQDGAAKSGERGNASDRLWSRKDILGPKVKHAKG